MTEIEFHVNVPDKLDFSCRLLRKAWLSGARVVVTAASDTLAELDHRLWSFSSTAFVPHCRAGGPQGSLAATPVLLVESLTECSDHGILVNLGQGIPAGFEPFERLIEVVACTEDDLSAGRSRWKQYASRGYALKKHERMTAGESA